MTRENLLKAIYDNAEEWSCQEPCPYNMEKENPKYVCIKCADRLLEEYEQKIRADAIDEIVEFANTMPTVERDDGEIRPMWLEEIAEQLKEKKND